MKTVHRVDEKSPIESTSHLLKAMLDSIGFENHVDMQNAFSSSLKAGQGYVQILVHSRYQYVDAVFSNGIASKDLLFQQAFTGAEGLKKVLQSNGVIKPFLKAIC